MLDEKRGILAELKDQVLLIADKPTKNGRIYTQDILQSIVNDPINKGKNMTHYNFIFMGFEPTMANVCACAENMRIENNILKVDVNILNTQNGRELNELLDKGEIVAFSCVGHGNLNSNNEVINYSLDYIEVLPNSPYAD